MPCYNFVFRKETPKIKVNPLTGETHHVALFKDLNQLINNYHENNRIAEQHAWQEKFQIPHSTYNYAYYKIREEVQRATYRATGHWLTETEVGEYITQDEVLTAAEQIQNTWNKKKENLQLCAKHKLDADINPEGDFMTQFLAKLEREGWQRCCCGKCIGCLQKRASELLVRGVAEMQQWEEGHCWFTTETYDPEHLPFGGKPGKDSRGNILEYTGTLEPEHTYKYRRAIIAHFDHHGHQGIRFQQAAEYGTGYRRPHYHHIFYNLPLYDVVPTGEKNELGQPMYHSPTLSRLWGKGRVEIGKVTLESIAYVAGYILDKTDQQLTGQKLAKLYEEENRVKEYYRCSLRPGIGHKYFQENLEKIYQNDRINLPAFNRKKGYTELKEYIPPRYCDIIYKRNGGWQHLEQIKARRQQIAKDTMAIALSKTSLNEVEYTKQQEQLKLQAIKNYKRNRNQRVG